MGFQTECPRGADVSSSPDADIRLVMDWLIDSTKCTSCDPMHFQECI